MGDSAVTVAPSSSGARSLDGRAMTLLRLSRSCSSFCCAARRRSDCHGRNAAHRRPRALARLERALVPMQHLARRRFALELEGRSVNDVAFVEIEITDVARRGDAARRGASCETLDLHEVPQTGAAELCAKASGQCLCRRSGGIRQWVCSHDAASSSSSKGNERWLRVSLAVHASNAPSTTIRGAFGAQHSRNVAVVVMSRLPRRFMGARISITGRRGPP